MLAAFHAGGTVVLAPSGDAAEVFGLVDRERVAAGMGRRAQPVESHASTRETILVGDIEMDSNTRNVRRSGEVVELTGVEYDLLEILLRCAGQIVKREDLVKEVLGRELSPFDRSIDMHVSKVRKKLGDSDGGNDHIKTVRGVGYIFARPRDTNPRDEARRSK